MNHFKNLDKKEKIELIKRIQAGEIHIINGEIIESGIVLIQHCDQYFFNGKPVDYDEVTKKIEAVIILPVKEGDLLRDSKKSIEE